MRKRRRRQQLTAGRRALFLACGTKSGKKDAAPARKHLRRREVNPSQGIGGVCPPREAQSLTKKLHATPVAWGSSQYNYLQDKKRQIEDRTERNNLTNDRI